MRGSVKDGRRKRTEGTEGTLGEMMGHTHGRTETALGPRRSAGGEQNRAGGSQATDETNDLSIREQQRAEVFPKRKPRRIINVK